MKQTAHAQKGPEVRGSSIRFRIPDPERDLHGVRLYQEIQRPRNGPHLKYDPSEGAWVGDLARPPADRLEYLIELAHADGRYETITDPDNPLTAPGPFGDKSVVELPGYEGGGVPSAHLAF